MKIAMMLLYLLPLLSCINSSTRCALKPHLWAAASVPSFRVVVDRECANCRCFATCRIEWLDQANGSVRVIHSSEVKEINDDEGKFMIPVVQAESVGSAFDRNEVTRFRLQVWPLQGAGPYDVLIVPGLPGEYEFRRD